MSGRIIEGGLLAALLRDMAARISDGDSFGGSIEYEAADAPNTFSVRGAYRIGNSEGQGGMRVIGSFADV